MIRGTKTNPIITVSRFETSGSLIFKGTYKNFMKWFNRGNDFKSGTVRHVYTDYGGWCPDNIEYFRTTKK
jgi:hypothetical protein